MNDDVKKLFVFSLIFGAVSGLAAIVPILGAVIF